jgi:hypothetical protein
MSRTFVSIALTLSVGLLLGCGKGEATYPVTGKVTYPDGTPLVNAQVSFESTTKPISAVGRTDASGVYKLTTYKPEDGAIRGEHRIAVLPPPQPTPEHDDESGKPLEYKQVPPPIDAKYLRFDTSGLTCTVDKAMTFDITVTKPK